MNLKKRACTTRTVLAADTTCSCNSGAASSLPTFLLPPPCLLQGAAVERADPKDPKCAMLSAKPSCFSVGAADFHGARRCPDVVFPALSTHRHSVVDARVRCAVLGAVLDADKLAENLRGVAVWIGAGQFHRVLAAQATFLHGRGGATCSKILA